MPNLKAPKSITFSAMITIDIIDLKMGNVDTDIIVPESVLATALTVSVSTLRKWKNTGEFGDLVNGSKYQLQQAYRVGTKLLDKSIGRRMSMLQEQKEKLHDST